MAKTKTSPTTALVRLPADLVEMLGWLSRLNGDETIGEIVDPLLRPAIEQRYAQIAHRVETIKAAEAGEPVHAPDLGGEA